ncbi:MAG: hypothetical protein A2W03_06565 [Candidatus Aminicenantes bacterium RBG_16_63_16]|nr:MAG: hypothetical protein A2W03_06565 [Candidatus Aminicenantes bacterium RBG_16_63_16]
MKRAPFLCLIAAALVMALAGPAAAQMAAADLEKIPAWLAESETYGFGVGLEALSGTAWKFITHVPDTAEFLGEARRRGVRTFPYMTFYQAYLAMTYQDFRLSDHPDWILVNTNGRWAPTGFWESEDAKNMYCTCPNVAGYADAVLAYLEKVMKRGASGIFLDNVHPNRECYGENFGKHKHMFPTQVEAFADLMRRARELIKKYDPDGALLINSADPASLPAEFWPSTDAEMSESYICTWVATDRWGDWHKNWNGLDKKVPAGKQVCCLSYLGHDTKHSFKDDAYFCYASARMMNFIWGAGYDKAKVGDDSAMRTLYSLTVGQPTAPETVVDDVHYRLFKNGLVTVNPTDAEKTLKLPAGLPTPLLWDVYEEKEVGGQGGPITLTLPPQSGRVYLFKPSSARDREHNQHQLIVRTQPSLGKTRFELDGQPMMTYGGRWTTEYIKGPNYGDFIAGFDAPGWHTITLVDEVRKEMLVANSYEDAYALNETKMPGATAGAARAPDRLGKYMDPSEPGKVFEGKPFRFAGWAGPVKGKKKTIRVYVEGKTEVTAKFERE